MLANVQNALSFISQVLKDDIIPAVDSLGSIPTVDISPILASLLTVQTSLTDLDALVVDSFNGIPKSLLLEYVVSANCTSVDLGVLFDINAHKSYRVEIDIINATSTPYNLLMYFNGDLTNVNYVSNTAQFSNVTSYQHNMAMPICAYVYASLYGSVVLDLSICNGIANYKGVSSDRSASFPITRVLSGYKVATVQNVTQLTFASSISLGIKAGTRFRVYRGDV